MSGESTPRSPRCSLAEKRHRTLLLQQAISAGEEPAAAARRLCAEWGLLPRRSVRRYITSAFESWARDRRLSHAASLDVAVATRRRLLRDAWGAGEFSAAARVLDGLDRLLGVDAPVDNSKLEGPISEVFAVLTSEIADRDTLLRVLGRIRDTMRGEPAAPVNGRALPFDGRNGTAPH